VYLRKEEKSFNARGMLTLYCCEFKIASLGTFPSLFTHFNLQNTLPCISKIFLYKNDWLRCLVPMVYGWDLGIFVRTGNATFGAKLDSERNLSQEGALL
jgi:hypothetical protein